MSWGLTSRYQKFTSVGKKCWPFSHSQSHRSKRSVSAQSPASQPADIPQRPSPITHSVRAKRERLFFVLSSFDISCKFHSVETQPFLVYGLKTMALWLYTLFLFLTPPLTRPFFPDRNRVPLWLGPGPLSSSHCTHSRVNCPLFHRVHIADSQIPPGSDFSLS